MSGCVLKLLVCHAAPALFVVGDPPRMATIHVILTLPIFIYNLECAVLGSANISIPHTVKLVFVVGDPPRMATMHVILTLPTFIYNLECAVLGSANISIAHTVKLVTLNLYILHFTFVSAMIVVTGGY